MKPNPVHRLPAPLEAAVQRMKLAAREAAERTIESLGLASLASTSPTQRDGLLGAQFELNRKSAVFVLTFNDAFDERLLREMRSHDGAAEPATSAPANWSTLSLVEDSEVEAQISADRFGMEIALGCEWELRELDAYVGALLGDADGQLDRNPLRPDLMGYAMIRGIEAVSDRAEIRTVLNAELGRSLASLLPATYAAVVAELRNAGVKPLGMALRNRPSHPGVDSVQDTAGAGTRSGNETAGSRWSGATAAGGPGTGASTRDGVDSRHDGRRSGYAGAGGGTPIGQVDPALMSLIRRLAYVDAALPAMATDYGSPGAAGGAAAPVLPNLIRAHRDELRQASRGSLDHMVIDVIGFLFDQILSDPKVPPQMARQIARLQLPVLRAALGDPSFFSSRRHPVRRFVNRIASLGSAFEDFDNEQARDFLTKVRELVQEVVEGDFDQVEVYERKLAALEAFTAEQARREQQADGEAAALLAEKEDQLRLRQLYAQRLEGDLKDVAAPPFLRDFITRVWSQVLLRAAEQGGADGPLAQRLRRVGRELFLSVQPKPTPAHRKAFLAELPKLMQELTEGMNLIGWPEAQRRDFFGQLMPAHAESLRGTAVRQLDINMMARQVEGALERPLPSRADVKAAALTLPVLTEEVVLPSFSADEASRVGLVSESSVDWDGTVDIEIGGDDASAAADDGTPIAAGLPAPAGPAEPVTGRALADHVQIGFAYQMHLGGQWQKVRLSHVSPGRSFFIFTHGARHKQTVSLTQRMLTRLAEAGRLRTFENGYLIDRATARARRQLASLGRTA